MKYTEEQLEILKNKIRSLLIRKPSITCREVGKLVEVDKDTAHKYMKAIRREGRENIDEQDLIEEVGKVEAEYEHLALELYRIVSDDYRLRKRIIIDEDGKENIEETKVPITVKEKLRAVKELRELKKTLFGIKFDCGIFEKKLGKLNISGELTSEEKELLKKAIAHGFTDDTGKDS